MIRIIQIALLLALAVGCASTRIDTYVNPGLAKGSIKSIAVLPIRNARLAPGEAQQMNRKITLGISSSNPTLSIVGPGEALRMIGDAGMAEDYARFVEDYVLSGIPDRARLGKIGGLLEVDALFQAEMISIRQRDGNFGGNTGETHVTLSASILSTGSTGPVLWQSTAEASDSTSTTFQNAPLLGEVIQQALDRMLNSIPAM